MSRAFAVCFLIFFLAPLFSLAQPDERIPVTDVELGVGDVPIDPLDIRHELHAAAISRLGTDAFRFTDAPAICGRAYSFEAERREREAIFRVAWLDGCARTGWRVTRRETFRLSTEEYDDLAEWIDEQMTRGRTIANTARPEADEGWVCMDGAALLTERLSNGSATWMTGSCGDDHPSTLIEQRLIDHAFHRMGR